MTTETTAHHQSDSNDDRVGEILQAWLGRREIGNAEPAEALINAHPELAPNLRECVEAVELLGESGLEQLSETPPRYPEIPDFEIYGELGRGGMGIVYEAHQSSLDRNVALKILPIATVDPDAAERFQREAETTAALHHTHIVPIHAVGHSQGVHWYAMQRIEGRPLNALLKENPKGVDSDEVARIGIEAADALQHAHHHGVVHRDIKPGNLLIQDDGHVWLTDFGLARRDVDSGATMTGAMLGSPRYMSPEHVFAPHGVVVDHRSDIYSLGATLYELATGTALFDGDSAVEVLQQIRNADPVNPRQIRSGIPRSLEIVLQKCLAKEPKERYQSAADLANDLRAIREGRPIQAKGVPYWVTAYRRLMQNRKRVKVGVAVFAATTAALLFGNLWSSYRAEQQFGQLQIESSGGPYSATVHEVGPDGADPHAVATMTVPMQQPIDLKPGDYRIRLAGQGKQSELATVAVAPGQLTESRYNNRHQVSGGIPREERRLSIVRSQDGHDLVAMLSESDLTVYGVDEKPLLTFDVSNLSPDAKPEGKDWESQFAYDKEARYAGPIGMDPYFLRPQRVMPSYIDLDNDGEQDFVIVARTEPAIAAIKSDASLKWVTKIELPPDADASSASPPRNRRNLVPFVLEVLPIDDVNQDEHADLLVNLVRIFDREKVEPFLATVSGASGDVIALASLPSRAPDPTDPVSVWPREGTLKYRFMNEGRESYGLQSSGIRLQQSRSHTENTLRMVGGKYDAIPVTPPVRLANFQGRQVATTFTATSMSAYDVASGEQVGGVTTLPFKTGATPVPVSIGDEALPAFLAWSELGKTANSQSLALIVLGEPQPRWVVKSSFFWNLIAGKSERSDFPICEDLDGDGVDEIIIPENPRPGWRTRGSIRCLDSVSGKSKWPRRTTIDSMEHLADRGVVVRDIDGDGTRDICIVTMSGRRASAVDWSTLSAGGTEESFRVFADLLSGADGTKLAHWYAPVESSRSGAFVVELDRLCSDGDSVVEASLVVGSDRETSERGLVATTVRFDLRSGDLPQVTRGLSRLGLRDSRIDGGFYLRRPGVDHVFDERVMWRQHDAQTKKIRTDVDHVVARWRNANGDSRLLVSQRAPSQLKAVDGATGRSLWSREFAGYQHAATAVLNVKGQSTRLFLHSDRSEQEKPCLVDAETGRVLWKLPKRMGGIVSAFECEHLDGDGIQLYGHAKTINGLRWDAGGVWLMQVDSSTGSIQWETRTLVGIAGSNYQIPHFGMERVDCDADGILDYVIGDHVGDGSVGVSAISGRDGSRLWTAPTKLPGNLWASDTPWPMMAACGTSDDPRLVLFDVEGDNSFALRMLRMKDGREIDKVPCAIQRRTTKQILNNYVVNFGMDRIDLKGDWPRFAFKYTNGETGRAVTWCQVVPSAAGFVESDVKAEMLPHSESRFYADADGDGVCEEFTLRGNTMSCRSIDGKPIWKNSDVKWDFRHRLIKDGNGNALAFAVSDSPDTVIDLRTGAAIWNRGLRMPEHKVPWTDFKTPIIEVNDSGSALVSVTRDDTAWFRLGDDDAAKLDGKVVVAGRHMDPRKIQRLPTSPLQHGETLSSMIGAITAGVVLAFFALYLPMLYLVRMIRRGYSLAYLFAAPIVAMFAVFAWQHLLDPSPEPGSIMAALRDPGWLVLIGGMVTLYALHVLVSAIRFGNVWILAAMVAATGLLTVAGLCLPVIFKWPGGSGGVYLWGVSDVVSMFFLCAIQTLILGSPLWIVIPYILKLRRKSQPVTAKVIG